MDIKGKIVSLLVDAKAKQKVQILLGKHCDNMRCESELNKINCPHLKH